MSQAQRGGQQSPRPTQVTMAGWLALIGSVLLLISVFDSVSSIRSLETREAIEEFLSRPPGEGLGLNVESALEILRLLMLFSGAAYAAAAVLAAYVLRRHRGARIGFTVTAAAIMLTAPLAGGFLPALVALTAITLWTRPARDWFAGRPPTAQGSDVRDPQRGRLMADQQPDQGPQRPEWPQGGPPPYAQGPYGSPPPYGQSGQGQQPTQWPAEQQSYPPPYQQSYPPYGGGYPGQQQDPDKRPATVAIAAWLTWVFSGLTLLVFGLMLVAVLAARQEFLDAVRAEPQFQNHDISADDLVATLWVVAAIFMFWCLSAIVLAVLAYRRVNWARIMLVVSAALTALLALIAIGSVISALHLLVAGAVVVLLFTGGANPWYSRRGGFLPGHPTYPPSPGYGGESSPGGSHRYGDPAGPPGSSEQQPPKNVW